MRQDDARLVSQALESRSKTRAMQSYWRENQSGERTVGYGNVLWHSGYEPFQLPGIPEIVDLNVLDAWQKRGIETSLIRGAEEIGIGHGLTPDCGAARRL